MSLLSRARRILRGDPRATGVRVHVLIRGRIGDGWLDVDETLHLSPGATLDDLVREATRRGIPMADALAHSPHLRDTLMLNGERCPVAEHGARVMNDGDEVYLLAPLAGG